MRHEFRITDRVMPVTAVLAIVPRDLDQKISVENFVLDEWGIQKFGTITVDGCIITGQWFPLLTWKDRIRRAWAALRYGR